MSKRLSPRRELVLAVTRAKAKVVAYQKAPSAELEGMRGLTTADDLHNATVALWQAAERYLKHQKGGQPNGSTKERADG